MSLISEWTTTLKQVFSSAGQFYENETDTEIGGKPIKIALVSLLLSGAISAVGSFSTGAMEAPFALLNLLLVPLVGIAGLAISAGLTHVVGMLLGFKNGYSKTFSAFAYATVIGPISAALGYIPIAGSFLALALGIFTVYVQTKGVQKFQETSFGRSLIAVVVPALIIVGIILAIVLLASAALVGLAGSTTPPM